MKKALLIGLIVSIIALSGIGAAFAGGISSWGGINVLSRGPTTVPEIGVDHMGYVLSSGVMKPAALVGVTLSFTADVPAGSVIFISARDDSTPSSEVAYYAGVTAAAISHAAKTTFNLYDTSNNQYSPVVNHPDASAVKTIVVTVAGGSSYNTP